MYKPVAPPRCGGGGEEEEEVHPIDEQFVSSIKELAGKTGGNLQHSQTLHCVQVCSHS